MGCRHNRSARQARSATAVRARGPLGPAPAIAKLATGRDPSHVQTERHDLERLVIDAVAGQAGEEPSEKATLSLN